MKLKECLEMLYVACTNYDKKITGKLGTEREYEGSYEQAYDTVLEELNNRIPIKKIKKVLEELDERVIYPDKCNYYARLTVGEALFLKHFIENEILNKE